MQRNSIFGSCLVCCVVVSLSTAFSENVAALTNIMSDMYSIEHAKSGRAACRTCKEKIVLDELRIGKSAPGPNGEFSMQTWFHVQCFTLPKKVKAEGIDVVGFVEDMLQDNTEEHILQSKSQEIIDKISAKRTPKKTQDKGKIAQIKAHIAQVSPDESPDEPPKKNLKFTAEEEDEMEVYGMYSHHKNDQLKDILRWNHQAVSGTKNELLLRIIDGHMHGRLGLCVLCGNGRLRIEDASGENAVCHGYFDEDLSGHIPCSYKCKLSEAPRLQPWYTEELPEEEKEEDDETGGDKKKLLDLASKLEWNLDAKQGIQKATADLIELCITNRVDIPSEAPKAKTAVGKIVAAHRDSTAAQVLTMVIDKFGFVSANEGKSKRKSQATEDSCVVAANAPILEVINELKLIYFKEGNSNAGACYTKAANAIIHLDFEVTEDNAKKLGKPGKLKVDGIGKGTADKIHEFITTGKIEKLEEKRAAHAD